MGFHMYWPVAFYNETFMRALLTWGKYLYIFVYRKVLQTNKINLGIYLNILCMQLDLLQKVKVGKNSFLPLYFNQVLLMTFAWNICKYFSLNIPMHIILISSHDNKVKEIWIRKYSWNCFSWLLTKYKQPNDPDINHKQLWGEWVEMWYVVMQCHYFVNLFL